MIVLRIYHLSAFFPLLVLSRGGVFSQELPVRQIPEVTVVQGNSEFFSDDHVTHSVNLNEPGLNRNQNLGYVLASRFPALVRTYGGAGSLISVALHGTGSNHTQVSWNGFPLNSPSAGQTDLSLIPAGFMQSVDIINGASGALFGSGTFGGSINLSNEPDWNNRLSLNYSLFAGSFGSLANNMSLRTGNRKLQYQLSAIISRSDNNFPYRDRYRKDAPVIITRHNAYRSIGLIQNLFLNLKHGNYLEGGIWYQQKALEIPALMGILKDSQAKQRDSAFRAYASYRKISQKSALVIKSAYLSDRLHYTDKNSKVDSAYSIDSRITTRRLMNEADYRYYLSSVLILGAGASYNRISGESVNYGRIKNENEYALFTCIKLSLPKVIINTGLRKEFYEGLNPRLQYSLGMRYKAGEHLVIRLDFSSKFRKPTFNEKYWRPGGNPLLRPERGRGGEITATWSNKGFQSKHMWFEAGLTGYYQWVDNWIQWVIRDSLTPVEYKKVRVRGVDSWLEYGGTTGRFTFLGSVNYKFNRSVIVNTYDHNPLYEGNQLMYAPIHAFRTGGEGVYGMFSAGFSVSYTGFRETVETADKLLRLPGYWLCDIYAGLRKEIRNLDLTFNFRIDNLFDTSYEVIRSFALPGRTFGFVIAVGYVKSDNKN